MAKKDMPKAGAYTAHEVGRKLYCWKGTSAKTKAVISAHGGYILSNKPFRVPANMTIHFYAPHGFILKDPGIRPVATGVLTPIDSYNGGSQCPNYILDKYQGKHGGKPGKPAETYNDIGQGMHKGAIVASAEAWQGRPLDEQQLAEIKDVIMDVITIRNRALTKSPTLEEVVKAVVDNKLGYTEIHCSFCRCRTGMPDECDMSWDARAGTVA